MNKIIQLLSFDFARHSALKDLGSSTQPGAKRGKTPCRQEKPSVKAKRSVVLFRTVLAAGISSVAGILYAAEQGTEKVAEGGISPFQMTILIEHAVVFLLAVGVTISLLWFHRRVSSRLRIVEMLPLRYMVFDKDDNILLHYSSKQSKIIANENGLRLADIKSPGVAELMRQGAKSVREADAPQTISYFDGEKGRTATISRLPADLFGREAFLWISQDTDELQIARKESRILAEHLRQTLHAIGEAVIVSDPQGKVTLLNPAAEAITGWSQTDALGQDIEQVFHLVTKPLFTNTKDAKTYPSNPTIPSAEFLLTSRRGSSVRISKISTSIIDRDGSSLGDITVFRDISEEYEQRRRLREALIDAEESSEWFRLTVNALGEGIITTDREGQVVMMNSTAEQLCGVSFAKAEGIRHENIFQLVGISDGIPLISPLAQSLQSGRLFDWKDHAALVSGDGRKIPVYSGAVPIHDKSGKILGGLLMFRDITEEYAGREKLRTALTGLELAAKLARTAYFKISAVDLTIKEASPLLAELLPINGEKVVSHQDCVLPEDLAEFQTHLQSLKRGKPSQSWCFRIKSANDIQYRRLILLLDHSNPDEDYYIGVVQDITELTHQQHEAENNLKLMNLVLDKMTLLLFVKDAEDDFRVTLSNRAIEEFLGCEKDELLGRTYEDLFPEPVASDLRQSDVKIMDEMKITDMMVNLPGTDGSLHYFHTTKVPFLTADGHKMLVGFSVDLTSEYQHKLEMEKLQTELQDLLLQYRTLLNALPIYIYAEDADNEFRHVLCNDHCVKRWGVPISEIIGKNGEELFGDGDETKMFLASDKEIMESGQLHEDVLPFTDHEGHRHMGRFYRQRLCLSGSRRWLYGAVVDITMEREREKHLTYLVKAIETTSKMTNSAAYHLNVQTREIEGTTLLPDLWPVQDGRAVPAEEFVLSDDLPQFLDAITSAKRNETKTFDVRFRSAWYGEKRYYRMQAEYLPDGEEPEYEVGIIQDVTESHKMSTVIKEASRQDSFFNTVLGLIPCQVFIKDSEDDFRYKIANRNFTDYYKLAPDKVLEHTDYEIFDTDVADELRDHDTRACAEPGKLFRFDEDISYRRAGNEIFNSLKLCFETSDHHRYLLGICVDVTELAQYAERMKKTQELWNLVLNTLPVRIFAKKVDDDFRYTIANQMFASFVGLSPEEVIGKTDAEIFQRPEDADWFRDYDRKTVEGGEIQKFIEHPVDCFGIAHHLQTIKLPAVATDGSRLLLGISSDITELNNIMTVGQINNEVLAKTVSEPDFGKVVALILSVLLTKLRCANVLFLRYFPEEKALKMFHEECVDPRNSVKNYVMENYEGLWYSHMGRLLKNELVLYDDFRAVPSFRAFLERFPDCPTRSAAASPVFVEEEPCGVLIIAYSTPHHFEEMDKGLLKAMSDVIALAAIRERQELSMSRSEREKRAILDNISIPLWLYNKKGIIIQTNRASDDILGEVLSVSSVPFFCRGILQCGVPESECPVSRTLRDGGCYHAQCLHKGRTYQMESRPILEADGSVGGAVCSFFDTTTP